MYSVWAALVGPLNLDLSTLSRRILRRRTHPDENTQCATTGRQYALARRPCIYVLLDRATGYTLRSSGTAYGRRATRRRLSFLGVAPQCVHSRRTWLWTGVCSSWRGYLPEGGVSWWGDCSLPHSLAEPEKAAGTESSVS